MVVISPSCSKVKPARRINLFRGEIIRTLVTIVLTGSRVKVEVSVPVEVSARRALWKARSENFGNKSEFSEKTCELECEAKWM